MGKFTLRAGLVGCAVAALFFLFRRFPGQGGELVLWRAALWPTSVLLGQFPVAASVGPAEWAAAAFSAVMNGAVYFGLAWMLWWAVRAAGWIRAAPSARDRFISFFLGMGLSFALLVILAEAAFRGLPKFGAGQRFPLYLVAANLFALIVITCLMAAWILWWLRGLYERRAASHTSPPSKQ